MYLDDIDRILKRLAALGIVGIILGTIGAVAGGIWLMHHVHLVWK